MYVDLGSFSGLTILGGDIMLIQSCDTFFWHEEKLQASPWHWMKEWSLLIKHECLVHTYSSEAPHGNYGEVSTKEY